MTYCPKCISEYYQCKIERKYNKRGPGSKALDALKRKFNEAKTKDKSWCDLRIKRMKARKKYKEFNPIYKKTDQDLEEAREKLWKAQSNLYEKSDDQQKSLIREGENSGWVDQRFRLSMASVCTESIFDQSEYEEALKAAEEAEKALKAAEEAVRSALRTKHSLECDVGEAENDIEEYEDTIKQKICLCTLVLSQEVIKT